MPIQPTKTYELYKGKIVIDFYEGKHRYVIRGKQDPLTGKDYCPPSVTSITGVLDKPALIIWAVRLTIEFIDRAVRMGERITAAVLDQAKVQHKIKKQEAADVGTMVHAWIEAYIDHILEKTPYPEMPNDEKAVNGVSAFLKWVKEHNVKFLESESIIYSKKHDYVGKMDVRLKLDWNGKKQVKKFADFKTNNWKENEKTGEQESRMYAEQRFQLAAYKNAWEEEKGEDGGGRLLIHINKDNGDFFVHDVETDKFGIAPDPDAYAKDIAAFLGLIPAKRRLKELETYGK